MTGSRLLDPDVGVWGDAVWGVARWGKLDIVSALQQPPGGGFPIGLGDWRVAVEILSPAGEAARWGSAVWGSAVWPRGADTGGIRWQDLGRFVRGVSWARGATSIGTRPENGVLELTLDNRRFQFSPWNTVTSWNGTVVTDPETGQIRPSYFAPGTVMRVAAFTPSGQCDPITDPDRLEPSSPRSWVPLFTGVVASWADQVVEGGADSFVTVTVEESLSALAQTVEPAIEPVGADDLVLPRLSRLLAAAGWRFGPVIDRFLEPLPTADMVLQPTTMPDNRLYECYVTADSVGAVFRSDRSGLPTVYNRFELSDAIGIREGPDAGEITGLASAGSFGAVAGWSAVVGSASNDAHNRARAIIDGTSADVEPDPAVSGPAQPGDRFTFTPSDDPTRTFWFEVDPAATIFWPSVWLDWASNRDTLGARHIAAPGLVVPYVADSVATANDDEVILNTVTLGNIGGDTVTHVNAESVELYDTRGVINDAFIGQSAALLELLAAGEVNARGALALRLTGLQLHSRLPGALSTLIGLDVDDGIPVELPPLIDGFRFIVPRAQILGMTHTLEPTAGGVVWVADYQLGLQSPLEVREA